MDFLCSFPDHPITIPVKWVVTVRGSAGEEAGRGGGMRIDAGWWQEEEEGVGGVWEGR